MALRLLRGVLEPGRNCAEVLPSQPDRLPFNRLGWRIELRICEVQPWESPGGPGLAVTSTGGPCGKCSPGTPALIRPSPGSC